MAARFELFQDTPGKWRWRLRDGNNVKIATSGEWFASKAGARRAAANVRATAPDAPIVDASAVARNAALRKLVRRRAA